MKNIRKIVIGLILSAGFHAKAAIDPRDLMRDLNAGQSSSETYDSATDARLILDILQVANQPECQKDLMSLHLVNLAGYQLKKVFLTLYRDTKGIVNLSMNTTSVNPMAGVYMSPVSCKLPSYY